MTDEVELPLLSNPRTSFQLVDTASALDRCIASLAAGVGTFAVDAERASGFKYSQRAYLIQVYREGSEIFLIDPTAFTIDELTPLANLLKTDTWILHAATQDLACLAEVGLVPKDLFDTELVSRLLGLERVGLGAVCELALQMRLAKEHSAADWSVRPLPDAWLIYAALDVDVLPEMMRYLQGLVESAGKGEIVRQEMQNLLKFKPKPQKPDRWRGVSGIQNIKDQRGLAIVRELWQAREQVAEKLDVSPSRLIPDRSISHVAAVKPERRSVLAADKQFHGRASRTYLDTWWSAIERGRLTNDLPALRVASSGIPNHRNWATKFPEADARLRGCREVITKTSERVSIPAENLLTPDYLRALCFEPAGFDEVSTSTQLATLGARAWQIELLVRELTAALLPQTEEQNPQAS